MKRLAILCLVAAMLSDSRCSFAQTGPEIGSRPKTLFLKVLTGERRGRVFPSPVVFDDKASSNPIVVVEGFDLENVYDWEELYELLNQEGLLEILRGRGFDAVVLNFAEATDHIQRNAYVLVRLIQQINAAIGPVQCVRVSPDGRYLASAGGDRIIRLWDTQSFTLVSEFTGHDDEVMAVAFSTDGSRLVSGGRDGNVLVWSLPDGQLTSSAG